MHGICPTPDNGRESISTRKVSAISGSDTVLGGWRRYPVKPAEVARRNQIAGAPRRHSAKPIKGQVSQQNASKCHETDSDSGDVDGIGSRDDRISRNRVRRWAAKPRIITLAHAGAVPPFVNSSQNIAWNLGSGGVVCEIGTAPTPSPPCAQHSASGTASICFFMSPGSYQIG
jgi:hypothetical protein